MKYFLVMAVALLTLASFTSTERFDKERCTCKGIPLWGKVRVVESGETFKVRVVESSEDVSVAVARFGYHPSRCGEWVFVESSEDFSIRYVSSSEDFSIRYTDVR